MIEEVDHRQFLETPDGFLHFNPVSLIPLVPEDTTELEVLERARDDLSRKIDQVKRRTPEFAEHSEAHFKQVQRHTLIAWNCTVSELSDFWNVYDVPTDSRVKMTVLDSRIGEMDLLTGGTQ